MFSHKVFMMFGFFDVQKTSTHQPKLNDILANHSHLDERRKLVCIAIFESNFTCQ